LLRRLTGNAWKPKDGNAATWCREKGLVAVWLPKVDIVPWSKHGCPMNGDFFGGRFVIPSKFGTD